jgi:hypothetical protein
VPTRQEQIDGRLESVGVENVYEYEAAGVGSCSSGACVSLISSGTSSNESAFLEATPTGNDVFLLTAAQLVPQDTDQAFDIYDARVCTSDGGCLRAPSPTAPQCGGIEECHAGPAPGPGMIVGSGSAAYTGPENTSHSPANSAVKDFSKSKSKPLTRAQRLAQAIHECRKRYSRARKKRFGCEARARKRYAPAIHSRGGATKHLGFSAGSTRKPR